MTNIYQEALEKVGLAEPGSDARRSDPALYGAAKAAMLSLAMCPLCCTVSDESFRATVLMFKGTIKGKSNGE